MKKQRKIPHSVLQARAAKIPLSQQDLDNIEKAREYGRQLREQYHELTDFGARVKHGIASDDRFSDQCPDV